MSNKKIPPLDLLFFLLETPGSPKHVGAVQIFQKPRNAPDNYMRDLVRDIKAVPVEPPFNYRPYFPRVGLPEWQEDDSLDIDYHIRHSALPQPGTDQQLLELLQRLHCGMLGRDRPGWIFQVIEGLEGDRFALYSKIHHAYIDGMSGVKRMYGSLSVSPDETRIQPTWSFSAAPGAKPSARPADAGALAKMAKALVAQTRAATEIAGSLRKMGREFIKASPGGVQPFFHAPRTRMNTPVQHDTRAIALCTLPLDKARAIGEHTGSKVNDVVLSVVDAALHEYLEAKNENTTSPLVALCPMSIREEGDDSASTQASALHVRLGEPGASPVERLQQVAASSRASKEEARAMSREALLDYALIMAGALELADRTPLGRLLSPSYNVLVSNVPGPGEDIFYLRGARQLASYPISAFLPGGNLNITLLSHGNSLDFGLVADKQALPDVALVARAMERRFAELEAAVLGPPTRTRGARRKARVKPAKKQATRGSRVRRKPV
ncbi:MAG: wax ester/triacylglycerol synthase family O-acyltransferase [Halieaceae bacterium]|jgi:WS/DGAT/MGAT family acyltransferase|nr:wax ester/triacylglycerol synthase family O-acyltransferase [Halieaceae bacterium]